MPSKQIIDREKRSLAIVAAGNEHADTIRANITTLLEPLLEKGERLPDVRLLVHLAVRLLEHDVGAMSAADEAHLIELGDDEEPRNRRDASAQELAATLLDLREISVGLFTSAVLPTLGLGGALPRDPATLRAFASTVAVNLRAKQLPAPRIPGAKFGAADWASRLEKSAAAVERALRDVAREAETTLNAKNAAIEGHDNHQPRVAGLIAGLLDLAGEPELAARVRPPTRTSRAVAATPPDPTAASPADATAAA